ncbi:MAG: hypothetical protein IT445_00145 [Phycisphaeraceae bacterium]|nr:hypothetical protein [Phycisphaeraceae bacterium]
MGFSSAIRHLLFRGSAIRQRFPLALRSTVDRLTAERDERTVELVKALRRIEALQQRLDHIDTTRLKAIADQAVARRAAAETKRLREQKRVEKARAGR